MEIGKHLNVYMWSPTVTTNTIHLSPKSQSPKSMVNASDERKLESTFYTRSMFLKYLWLQKMYISTLET